MNYPHLLDGRSRWIVPLTNDIISPNRLEYLTMNQLPPLNALRAFEAIARHLSFARAADELHVTPAELSLGTALFHRRARAIELTDAGQLIYPGLHAGFESVRGAVRQLERDRSGNVLVISATPGLVAKWLTPRLSASLKLVDFAAEGVDVGIRLSKHITSDLHVELLFEDAMVPVCAPQLV